MNHSTGFFLILAALIAFSVGYRENPFRAAQKSSSRQIKNKYQKLTAYYDNGNYEGALALAKEIKKVAPHYQELEKFSSLSAEALIDQKNQQAAFRPFPARLPASLRDSFYDAKIAFQQGHCEEVLENLKPIERYQKNFKALKVYENCKAKNSK